MIDGSHWGKKVPSILLRSLSGRDSGKCEACKEPKRTNRGETVNGGEGRGGAPYFTISLPPEIVFYEKRGKRQVKKNTSERLRGPSNQGTKGGEGGDFFPKRGAVLSPLKDGAKEELREPARKEKNKKRDGGNGTLMQKAAQLGGRPSRYGGRKRGFGEKVLLRDGSISDAREPSRKNAVPEERKSPDYFDMR